MPSPLPAQHAVSSGNLACEAVALVLAEGNGTRLGGLTQWVCKPALSFAGRYRNIDFSLSNCLHSGIRRVAVLTQYKAQELIRHLESAWSFLPRALGEFVEIWPAQQRTQAEWYTGTANAVLQNLDMLRALGPRHVVVLAGDHVYQMDYRKLLAAHVQRGADVTVACVQVPRTQARHFGIVTLGEAGRITGFVEKPQGSQLQTADEAVLASMGVYIFKAEYLYELLAADATRQDSAHDFGRDLLPAAVSAGSAAAYMFENPRTGLPGYWRDVGTIESYWRAHMELLDPGCRIELFDPSWPILAQPVPLPPSQFLRTSSAVTISDSIVADGCVVEGSTLIHSVIGSGARIGDRSVIRDSVILPGTVIRAGSRLRGVVVAGDLVLPADERRGPHERSMRPVSLRNGEAFRRSVLVRISTQDSSGA